MNPRWLARRQPGWFGIDLCARRIEVAQVCRAASGRPQVMLCAAQPHDEGDEAVLARVGQQLGLRRGHCATLLRPGEYQLLQVEAPAVPEQELAQALRWQVKDMLEFPVEEATVEGFAIPLESAAGARRPQAVAVAARNELLRRRVDRFSRARIGLEVIDVPELAQRNLAALFEDESRGLGLLVIDEDGSLLTLTYRGELYGVRRVDVGTAQLLAADPTRQAQLVERIVLEVQRTLDNFDRQYNFITVSKLIATAVPEVPSLHGDLAANLYVPVEVLDLARVMDLDGLPELREPARAVASLGAIGAALRPEPAR